MKLPKSLSQLPIAHRGLHAAGVPENSLAAFVAAAERGYAIETDVRFTKDKQLVLFHDDTVDRMTDGAGNVSAFSFIDLRELRLERTEERVPLLEELLEIAAGRVPLLLEIKNMPGIKGNEIAAAIAKLTARFPVTYAVQSFQPMYVRAYKKLCPQIAGGVLGSGERFTKSMFGGSPFWRLQAHVIKHCSMNFIVAPDFISYRAQDLPTAPVSRFRGTRLAWVVRSREEEADVRRFADNIIFEGYLPHLDRIPAPPPEVR